MSDELPSARSVFERAIEIFPIDAREAFLDDACTGNRPLRDEVEKLLRSYEAASTFLETPIVEGLEAGKSLGGTDRPGQHIGPYELLKQIGEGGMGVVYLAEQSSPVERRVALKVIKPGMDSRQVIARFEAERQALALMEHPHIAKVFDAGATESGRPYFVMELVSGVPITRYCDEHQLTPRQRLELMVPVCQAVQHAHQKGIIHRDLKPSNILVTEVDGKPVPKVIDFGVAKAIGQQRAEKSVFTEIGQVVGTIEYMSPEQAKFNPIDIDTRTDIYSLGVLLYELLTGQTPFGGERLRSAAFDEMLRIIREEDPPKPSTKLSSCDSLPSIAACRHSEPRQLTHQIQGELDWIVMKALEKDRNRRYETANGMALDLLRFLNDEPVLACPPSRSYRLRKFLNRHRRAVLAATIMLALLVAGIVGTSLGLVRALDAEARARNLAEEESEARKQESLARQQESEARQKEAAQRKQAEAVVEVLESVFEDLDPRRGDRDGVDLKTRLIERLDEAAKHLEEKYSGEPVTRARLRKALAVAQDGIGSYAKAAELLEKARSEYQAGLGADHSDTLSVRHRLGSEYLAAGRLDEAIRVYEETLKDCEAKLGADDPHVLKARNNLATAYRSAGRAEDAVRMHETVLKVREAKLGADHADTLSSQYNLGVALDAAGRRDDAIRLYEETLKRSVIKFGAEHYFTLGVRNSLAVAYRRANRLADAIREHEQVLKARIAKLGVDHPDTLTSRNSLAAAYKENGRNADAIRLHEENLPLREAKLGLDHPGTLVTVHNLAVAFEGAGQRDKALPLYQRSVEGSRLKLGADHPDTLSRTTDWATSLARGGRLDEAIPLYEQTLAAQTKRLGASDKATRITLGSLAAAHQNAGHYEQAEPLLRKALELARENRETTSVEQLLSNLGSNLLLQKKPAAAEPLFRECLEIHVQSRPDEWPRFRALSQVGNSLLRQERYTEAEPLLLEAQRELTARSSAIPVRLRNGYLTSAAQWLAELYEGWEKPEQAIPWREKAAGYRQGGKVE